MLVLKLIRFLLLSRNWYITNYNEAVKYYKLAAEQGYAGAQSNLGFCYENGLGVPVNYMEAIKWYRLSAEQQDFTALYNLGYCYEKGYGVIPNKQEAFKYYSLSAKYDYAMAQYKLGTCYTLGHGVKMDYGITVFHDKLFYKWFNFFHFFCSLFICFFLLFRCKVNPAFSE